MKYIITTYTEEGEEIITREYKTITGYGWLDVAQDNITKILIDSEEQVKENK